MIATNGWLSEVNLDEVQRNIKEEENMEKPRTELQSTCDHRMVTGSQVEHEVELANIENLFNRLAV